MADTCTLQNVLRMGQLTQVMSAQSCIQMMSKARITFAWKDLTLEVYANLVDLQPRIMETIVATKGKVTKH